MDSKGLHFSPDEKGIVKKGRRAGVLQQNVEDEIGFTDDLLESPIHSLAKSVFAQRSPNKVTRNEPSIPPRSRKNGGWADDDVSKTNKSKRNSLNLIEQERFKSPDRQSKDDSDDDIPLIPDLDEIQEDEILCKVADAPFVVGNKVASFTELDTDLGKKSFLYTLENINLNSLTNHLLPEDDIKEDNLQWTWDLLFTEVASDLRYEWDAQTKDVLKD